MGSVLPSPPPLELLAAALLFYLGGAVTPLYYMQERLRGFGRWLASKLPYEPPPGEEAGQAMEEAVETGEAHSTDESSQE